MKSGPYILWDWNGTLLDDSAACVGALNRMLAGRGLPPIDLERYRRDFSFPARGFYERIGMRLELEDWDALAKEYHDAYLAEPAVLAADAVEALRLARSLACGQSIISALRQDHLDIATDRYGVREYFDVVRGTDNLDGASKLERAHELVGELAAKGVRNLVLIGDSLHDKEVADAIGARAVLYSGGSHAAERLAPFAPVSASLVGCVRLAVPDADSAARAR